MMRLPTPGGPAARLSAAGLLLSLIAGLCLFVIAPVVVAWREANESVASAQSLLTGFRRVGAELPALEAQLKTLAQTDTAQPGLLDATNAPLAAAKLQGAVKSIVETEGGEVKSVQQLPPTRSGTFQQVAIRLDLSLGNSGLQRTLYRIEAAQPFMFVDNLSIRASEAPRVAGPRPNNMELSVRLEVYGYIRAPQP